jgi:hypothetical protein
MVTRDAQEHPAFGVAAVPHAASVLRRVAPAAPSAATALRCLGPAAPRRHLAAPLCAPARRVALCRVAPAASRRHFALPRVSLRGALTLHNHRPQSDSENDIGAKPSSRFQVGSSGWSPLAIDSSDRTYQIFFVPSVPPKYGSVHRRHAGRAFGDLSSSLAADVRTIRMRPPNGAFDEIGAPALDHARSPLECARCPP